MKITELNFDCLESCLEHLDIKDLLNIADASKQLRNVARVVYNRKFKQRTVFYGPLKCKQLEKCRSTENALQISSLKWNLQFLRCFGDLVSEIYIKSSSDHTRMFFESFPFPFGQDCYDLFVQSTVSIQWEHLIIEYINEYCFESLTKLSIRGQGRESGFNKLTNTFSKVEQIEIEEVYPITVKLYELFPNLRKLMLSDDFHVKKGFYLHYEYIAGHFPYLEELRISFDMFDHEAIFDKENIATALRSNPQLKSLCTNVLIDVVCNTKHFSNPKETYLPNLEKLVAYDACEAVKTIDETIKLNNLKELELTICNVDSDNPWVFPFASNKLESLKVYACDNNMNFSNLIPQYPTLKKISLVDMWEINHIEIWERMPLLEEIYLYNHANFTVDQVISFINQFHSLRVFLFRLLIEINIAEIMKYLGNTWSYSSTPYGNDGHNIITLKRQI